MHPQTPFCHNPDCRARGQVGQGNIRVHSQAEQRYRCTTCGQTFAAPTGTPFYRWRTAADLVTLVLTWLSHGCPTQAIVAALGLDERTVAAWWVRAGHHCQQVHQHVIQQGQVDLQHVQADELWVKLVGRRVWRAMAMAVPSRLGLGGVISPHRDLVLLTTLVQLVRSCAHTLAIWGCVEGWPALSRPVRGCSGSRAAPATAGDPAWGRSQSGSWAKWSSATSSGGWRAWNTGSCGGPRQPSVWCWPPPAAARGSIPPTLSG